MNLHSRRIRARTNVLTTGVTACVVVSCLFESGCDRAQSPSAEAVEIRTADASPPSDQPSVVAVVQLSSLQLDAVRIEPVGSYSFAMEKEGVGNIDFEEDLGLVQAESALLTAAASYELSDKVLSRAMGLFASNGGIPQKELEQAVSEHQSAEAALTAARNAVRALGRTDPEIDRVVAARKIEGASPSTKWMVANVPESDAPNIVWGSPRRSA
jgi:membrane fusion protein, heavy metal efflux system